MNIEEKLRLTKAILLRIYKEKREEIIRDIERGNDPNITVREGVFASLGNIGVDKEELTKVILPYLKEQGFLNNWYYMKNYDEDDECTLDFNTEVMDKFNEPIEKTKIISGKVEYDELNGILSYGNKTYKPSGGPQRKAVFELWENKAWPSKGIGGQKLPLATFGSRIEFEGITSTQKFKEILENDDKFKEKFENFYKGVGRAIKDNGVPARIKIENNSIQLIVEE